MKDLNLLTGNVLDRLRELPDESVHCVVTSPPYWGLRDYGGWKMAVLWGKPKHFHAPSHPVKKRMHLDLLKMRSQRKGIVWSKNRRAHICAYGLEPTPELYLKHTVEIFREVRRVLRRDGTAWINLGDSYAGSWNGYSDYNPKGIVRKWVDPKLRPPQSFISRSKRIPRGRGRWGGGNVAAPNLKAKDLCGIPWRVAFALQADGWWLRSDIIWSKPNPMPESINDRPTKAHEYVFLLSRADRYFYDAEAILEPSSPSTHARLSQDVESQIGSARAHGGTKTNGNMKAVGRKTSSYRPTGWATGDRKNVELAGRYPKPKNNESFDEAMAIMPSRRNKRTVWTIPIHSFKGAHFATFPPDLIKPCILAGTSAKGCCAECGAPWERVVELGAPDVDHQRACGGDLNGNYFGESTKDFAAAGAQDASAVKARILAGMRERKTKGWIATCDCESNVAPRPCVVLDPFGGSGTTGMVALELGRHVVLIELNPEYARLIETRCAVTPGLQLA